MGTKKYPVSMATFTLHLFGVPCWKDDSTLRIGVRALPDQQGAYQSAKLQYNRDVTMIHMLGGQTQVPDFSELGRIDFTQILGRVMANQVKKCSITSSGPFRFPIGHANHIIGVTRRTGSLYSWIPILVHGTSRASLSYPWVSWPELEAEKEYRCSGPQGKEGLVGEILHAAFQFYAENRHLHHLFSVVQ